MSVARPIRGFVAFALLFGVLLFAPARTFHWPRAWVLLALISLGRIAYGARLMKLQPELVKERSKRLSQPGQPRVDRILLASFMATYAGVVAFCSADRWHWLLLPEPPLVARVAGLVVALVGWHVTYLALRENAFATTVVRHQEERGHRVVDTGVYAHVRHPLYTGAIIAIPGMALWLGSLAGVIASAIPIGILVARIVFEERFLRRELAGYEEYARRVRWRLLPKVW